MGEPWFPAFDSSFVQPSTTFANSGMSHTHYDSPTSENWQDLVVWDDEFYDNLFQKPVYAGLPNSGFELGYHLSESLTSEQPYLLSNPASVADDPPSLGYTVSAPQSRAFDLWSSI
jgi:hypothetical protein